CWNSIANGADGIVFFRWRSLPYGAEAHWNGLLYHDERNTWRLDEAKRLGQEIDRLSATLTGTRCASPAAILYDFDNNSHAKIEHATGKHREASERAVYQALAERHLSADICALSSVQRSGDLSAYQIVFFPHAHVLAAADTELLQDYVEAGGTLVFGCWSGYRDRNHWCYDATGKAFYEDFVGARVSDFTVVTPGETSSMRFDNSDAPIEAPTFNEVLAPVTADVSVLASYTSDYYAGQPAVTLHKKGKGRVIHFGSFFTSQNVTSLLDALAIQDPVQAWVKVPAEVQVTLRSNDTEHFCFLLNFSNESKAVTFNQPTSDLLEERELNGQAEVPPYGVRLIRL
ncbi:MAG: beta-galactosidase trimerization domain-containing protein, partial [Terrimicrobiaceae bacterium]